MNKLLRCLAAAVLMFAVAVMPLFAQPATNSEAKAAVPRIDAKAADVLKQMAEYFKELKTLSYDIQMLTKVQMGERKTELDLTYDVAMERPNKFAMESKTTNQMASMMSATIVSDGTNLYTYVPGMKKYTKAKAPEDLDGISSRGGAGNIMGANAGFTDALFARDPYQAIVNGVDTGAYVGIEQVDGKEAHHLKFTQPQFDWDIWVQTGKEPVVLKLVPDMTKMFSGPGVPEQMKNMKMETALLFKDWQMNAPIPGERFRFTPPREAKLVESFFGSAQEPNPLLGKAAPDFKLDLLEGGKMSLAQHKGKDVVILDFWATWCGPCMKALPTLIEVADAYKGKGVMFYAVNQREEPDVITKALQKNNWKLTVPLDKDGAVGDLYHVTGIPQTVIVDKDGTVQVVHVGLSPNLKSKLTEELDALLAGKKLAQEADSKSNEKKK